MFRFIFCVASGVIAGNMMFAVTESYLACAATSFVVSFCLTTLTEKSQ